MDILAFKKVEINGIYQKISFYGIKLALWRTYDIPYAFLTFLVAGKYVFSHHHSFHVDFGGHHSSGQGSNGFTV